jgi:hypothetical protein
MPDLPVSPQPNDSAPLPRTSARTARRLRITVFAIFVGVFVVGLFLHLSTGWYFVSLAVGLAITVWLMQLWLRAKKYAAVSAEEVMAADTRPPVLYLRSFMDDAAASGPVLSGPPGWVLLFPKELVTEEELLARTLKDFGPVVTIGKPSEELRQLGAARMYVSDAEWQEKVSSLIHSSQLVVLRLGQTEGFWWELENAIRQMNPHQLVVLVPTIRKQDARDTIRRRAEALFPKPLPEFTRATGMHVGVGSLRGYLYFDPDWTAHYVDMTRRIWTIKTLPRFLGFGKPSAKLKYALQPLYSSHGLTWTPPPVRRVATTLAAIWLVAATAIVVLVIAGALSN